MPLHAGVRSLRFDCIEFILRCAGIVSFSSRIIAAWRAIETEDGGALFQDPLAETLAGTRAMQRARQRIKVSTVLADQSSHQLLLCGDCLLQHVVGVQNI